tara:strand:- start:43 stop:543 length:501 start_codon:yes stop_codon:yes gene_type:complete
MNYIILKMYNLIRHSVWTDDWQMTKNNRNVPPGLMQYKVSQEAILSLLPNGTKNINCVYNKDWSFAQHTLENLQKLTPNTKTGKANKWKIILIIKATKGDGKECLKGALLNKDTNEIALMTSLNKEHADSYRNRLVKSLHKDYKICQCKMIAPLVFWDELKNRLLY